MVASGGTFASGRVDEAGVPAGVATSFGLSALLLRSPPSRAISRRMRSFSSERNAIDSLSFANGEVLGFASGSGTGRPAHREMSQDCRQPDKSRFRQRCGHVTGIAVLHEHHRGACLTVSPRTGCPRASCRFWCFFARTSSRTVRLSRSNQICLIFALKYLMERSK